MPNLQFCLLYNGIISLDILCHHHQVLFYAHFFLLHFFVDKINGNVGKLLLKKICLNAICLFVTLNKMYMYAESAIFFSYNGIISLDIFMLLSFIIHLFSMLIFFFFKEGNWSRLAKLLRKYAYVYFLSFFVMYMYMYMYQWMT